MISVHQFSGFDDSSLDRSIWDALARRFQSDNAFITWAWQAAWWDAFARGKLILLLAKQNNEPVCIAPLFADAGMVFFTGSGGSDYLDFAGDVQNISVVTELLIKSREQVPDFLGFRFYHVPSWSNTGKTLKAVAENLGMQFVDEGELAAPSLSLREDPHAFRDAAEKKSLLRHERWFEREGVLEVEHLSDPDLIEPWLPDFFDQHIRRWESTPYPSLFRDPQQCAFYRSILARIKESGANWLRFTRILWNEEPIAYHLGFQKGGRFLWYKPTFEINWANRSPGSVLLRNLIELAESEGAQVFDFGLGDEAFKQRFTNHTAHVRTWGLYPVK